MEVHRRRASALVALFLLAASGVVAVVLLRPGSCVGARVRGGGPEGPVAGLSTGSSASLTEGQTGKLLFLRFKLTLETTFGDNNDTGVATFDLHANLTRK